ncbi:MAG: hypothetical protein WC113_01160 [Candidatus Paceibacterota bacterium]|jgi:hypothetical protein
MENKNPKINIQSNGGGNLQWVDIQGVDIENNGNTSMSEINLKDSGYSNEKSGITNVEGRLNTNSSIRNEGLFNIKKTGEVNIFRVSKFKKDHPIFFWSAIFGIISTILTFVGLLLNLFLIQ